jgi:hypothetical protein
MDSKYVACWTFLRIGNIFRGYLYMVQKNNIRIGDYECGLLCLLIKWYADQNRQLFS